MKIRIKNGTEFKVASIKKNIDHNAYYNIKLNNTTVVLNITEVESQTITVEYLEELLSPENVSEVTFIRENGVNVVEHYERVARITQTIDDYGMQIFILLSKDKYVADPPEGASI